MEALTLSVEKQNLYGGLREKFAKMISITDAYINRFDARDFFVFSKAEERLTFYKKEFFFFAAQIADPMLEADRLMGEISSLLIRADAEMSEDIAYSLRTLFESYLSFKERSSTYFSVVEKMLSSRNLSASTLLDGAKGFKFSIIELNGKIT